MKNVVIIGTGGHAKVVADIVLCSGDNLVGFITSEQGLTTFMGKPVLGKDTEYKQFIDNYFVIAIGNADVRERLALKMGEVKYYTAIHPKATVSSIETFIDKGSVVMANAVVNPFAQIGKHCIINTGAIVEHDNIIEEFAHVSVGAKLSGNVKIGKKTWIGAGATVINGISICEDCMVGAAAAVVKNINEKGTYVGVPASKKTINAKL